MTNLVIICEGQTEVLFIKNMIVPYLKRYNIFVEKNDIISLGGGINLRKLKEKVNFPLNQGKFITTFIDLYGNNDLFDLGKIENIICPYEKSNILANYLHEKVNYIDNDKFIPYIQPYEVETLLFSNLDKFHLIANFQDYKIKSLKQDVDDILKSLTPEHINNGDATAPAKRIEHFIPEYSKTLHITTIAKNIGLEKIKQECKHFSNWLERLKSLSNTNSNI